MRNLLGWLFYVAAVFCLSMLGLTAFVSVQTIVAKWPVSAALLAATAVVVALALALSRFKNWRLNIGLVLLAACLAVCGVMFFIMANTTDAAAAKNVVTLYDLGDYRTGGGLLTLFLAVAGGLLLWHSRVVEVQNKMAALRERIQRL